MPETNKKPLLQTKEEAQVNHEKSDLHSDKNPVGNPVNPIFRNSMKIIWVDVASNNSWQPTLLIIITENKTLLQMMIRNVTTAVNKAPERKYGHNTKSNF